MRDPLEYPLNLTEDEFDLGFLILEVDGLGGELMHPAPAVAIVRILSTSEILVKTQMGYSHRGYGDFGMPTFGKVPTWTPLHDPTDHADQFLHDYELGLLKPSINAPKFCVFGYRKV